MFIIFCALSRSVISMTSDKSSCIFLFKKSG
jgi:hypothetical protein